MAHSQDAKPELVVIVGSGASVACGIPSTGGLTALAKQSLPAVIERPPGFRTPSGSAILGFSPDLETPVEKPLLDGLNRAFAHVDFELILHALLHLENFTRSWESQSLANLRPVMTAFADLRRDFDPLNHSNVIHAAHREVTRAIHKHIAERCAVPSPGFEDARNRQDHFIQECARHFRLVVIDLNYDDLFDRMDIPWCDGFELRPGSSYSLFQPPRWLHGIENHEHLLIHLHGSVRYGFSEISEKSTVNLHEPAKYTDPLEAHATFVGRDKSDPLVAGSNVSAFPIVTALDKAARLAHNVRPFAYHNSEAGLALARTSRLCVIGYSGRDLHLQGWIEEHATIHGQAARAVAISRRDGNNVGDLTDPLEGLLRLLNAKKFLSDIPWSGGEQTKWRTETLMLLADGAPSAYNEVNDIIQYLRS